MTNIGSNGYYLGQFTGSDFIKKYDKDGDGKVGNLEHIKADGDTFTIRLDGKVVTTTVDESSSASIYGDSIRLSPTTRLTLEDGIWHHSQPRTRYRKPVSMMQTTQTCIIPSTSRIPSGSQPMLLIDLSFASCRRLAAFSLITPTASQPRRILTLESNN